MTALRVIDDRSNPPRRAWELRALASYFRARLNRHDADHVAAGLDQAATEYEEMLAALKEIGHLLSFTAANGSDEQWAAYSKIIAAIAKAEGRS